MKFLLIEGIHSTEDVRLLILEEAKKYFDTVETETPATHKRLLTELCYKQIAKLTKHQKDYPTKAHITSKSIETWANRIASINGLYNETNEIAPAIGDTYILLSSATIFGWTIPLVVKPCFPTTTHFSPSNFLTVNLPPTLVSSSYWSWFS